MTSFVAIVGAAGLAVGLALQGTLQNFAGGVIILILRPFKVGDYVEGGGLAGTVNEIQIFNTILLTPDNVRVIIPNGKLSNENIKNYSAEDKRRVDMVFGIGYGDDIKKAKDTLYEILKANDKILSDPAPTVAVSELADSSVNFVVRPWVKNSDYWPTYFEIHEAVKKEFDAQGISIPFPQRDVHLFQESE
jgi:small conductance mechanosensitive channel